MQSHVLYTSGVIPMMAEATASGEPIRMETASNAVYTPSNSWRSSKSRSAKKLLDIFLALASLTFFLPVFLLICLALFLQDGAPIFYKQRRIGLNGREFSCFKFRSMVRDSDARLQALLETSRESREEWVQTRKLKKDPRIHAVGAFLRRSSLDELPQLLNVLRGDMSIVGPRPIVREEIHLYGDDFAHYVAVKPGLTGLWQVSGRNDVSYQERVSLDRRYVETRSLRLDLSLIAKTAVVLLTSRGAY